MPSVAALVALLRAHKSRYHARNAPASGLGRMCILDFAAAQCRADACHVALGCQPLRHMQIIYMYAAAMVLIHLVSLWKRVYGWTSQTLLLDSCTCSKCLGVKSSGVGYHFASIRQSWISQFSIQFFAHFHPITQCCIVTGDSSNGSAQCKSTIDFSTPVKA